jgi:hypothetical protein
MNYNPSPKSQILENADAIKSHHVLVEDNILRAHFTMTLAEMQRRAALTDPANFNACAAAHLRMLGAQEFVDTFMNLAEAAELVTRTDKTNLAGNVPNRK